MEKCMKTLINAEEAHLVAVSSTMTSTTKITKKKTTSTATKKPSKTTTTTMSSTLTTSGHKQSREVEETATATIATTATTATATIEQQQSASDTIANVEGSNLLNDNNGTAATKTKTTAINNNSSSSSITKKEKRSKKQKKEQQQHHISLKSSLSKFDALQKSNQPHSTSNELDTLYCRQCTKPVYKMEEIKAERSVYHKNCFRCRECNKQLKVDNYQSDAGALYCLVHFKLLFAPKCVEPSADAVPEKPRKPELIIRENEPLELPPDVVRSSLKSDLGLAELQQLNLRAKFQMFEHDSAGNRSPSATDLAADAAGSDADKSIKLGRHNSILTKLAKLQARGLNASTGGLKAEPGEEDAAGGSSNSEVADSADDDNSDSSAIEGEDEDARLLRRSRKSTQQRERPIGLGQAMDDIKSRFEHGHTASKEERREERKQELQNIRSRLFLGKQARIKEMYQQAVADSEHGITSAGKVADIEIGNAARAIKERFETGDAFKKNKKKRKQQTEDAAQNDDDEADSENQLQQEADVFESGISKQSRNIFMTLDANVMASGGGGGQLQAPQRPPAAKLRYNKNHNNNNINGTQANVVKCDENAADVQIATAELSEKFKFFETYRPAERQRKQFRITPPREGDVPLASALDDEDDAAAHKEDGDSSGDDRRIIGKSQTTSRMLDKFRAIEQEQCHQRPWANSAPRPLKCFTPPPDGGKRLYANAADSDYDDDEDDDDDCDDEDEEDEDENENENDADYAHRAGQQTALNDAALLEAKALARTKQLRAKFEKWETAEQQRANNEDRFDVYSAQVSDDSNIESTKTIRQHFENLQHAKPDAAQSNKVRYQVNRFV